MLLVETRCCWHHWTMSTGNDPPSLSPIFNVLCAWVEGTGSLGSYSKDPYTEDDIFFFFLTNKALAWLTAKASASWNPREVCRTVSEFSALCPTYQSFPSILT
jgi:hypothetical protein